MINIELPSRDQLGSEYLIGHRYYEINRADRSSRIQQKIGGLGIADDEIGLAIVINVPVWKGRGPPESKAAQKRVNLILSWRKLDLMRYNPRLSCHDTQTR